MEISVSNLLKKDIESDMNSIFSLAFEMYKHARSELFRKKEANLPKKLIELYYKDINPDYNDITYNFRKKYIVHESSIENNNSPLEQKGIGLVYDYIQKFNPEKDDFNIFITSLQLHNLLYKPLDENANKNAKEEYQKLLSEIEIAKQNKDLKAYREKRIKLQEASLTISTFGGRLRDDQVHLKGIDIDVPSAEEAKQIFNSYASTEKKISYQNILSTSDLFYYIEFCIRLSTYLIKLQPFQDGNKRTFRALLNLMFKMRNIPPVYIYTRESKFYKNALIKAMKDEDYTDLFNLYYFKICDSIYELDINEYISLEGEYNLRTSDVDVSTTYNTENLLQKVRK